MHIPAKWAQLPFNSGIQNSTCFPLQRMPSVSLRETGPRRPNSARCMGRNSSITFPLVANRENRLNRAIDLSRNNKQILSILSKFLISIYYET